MLGIWKGGMLEAARIYEDAIGGTLKWPTGNDMGTNGLITGRGRSPHRARPYVW